MRLPDEFLNRMKEVLKEKEFEDFIDSYNKTKYNGLRINSLKVSVEDFKKISPFVLTPVPWTKDGFYFNADVQPGKHPYYHAGLYYIQEPSAMYPVTILDPKPDEVILDLCAAPGGKTVQIASMMQDRGVIIANEVHKDRAKALIKNIEMAGIRNIIVTNETPENLEKSFEGFFDKILVDAPCSGEGMFRKDPDAIKSWSRYKSEDCSKLQESILISAAKMLKPGGIIVYSTCTFSPLENEKIIEKFIKRERNFQIINIEKIKGIESGRIDWTQDFLEIKGAARLWPHKINGEGHFVCALRKVDGDRKINLSTRENYNKNNIEKYCLLEKFEENELCKQYTIFDKKNLFDAGGNLYIMPKIRHDFKNIRVLKFGWYIGKICNNYFEPSHSMVMSLKPHMIKRIIDFSSDSYEIKSYLRGETLNVEANEKGYYGICVDRFLAGWAKSDGRILKNLYPKGWRRLN